MSTSPTGCDEYPAPPCCGCPQSEFRDGRADGLGGRPAVFAGGNSNLRGWGTDWSGRSHEPRFGKDLPWPDARTGETGEFREGFHGVANVKLVLAWAE